MSDQSYRNQVNLLLQVIPSVAEEKCFALHGGTAINLFVRDLPRLSVDIDLTFKPIEDRETSLISINEGLANIEKRINASLPNVSTELKPDIAKLIVSGEDSLIKVEVNKTIRGILGTPEELVLCDKAQEEFEAFCAIDTVPLGQLYGGKICAALDRQHPRDLFDVKLLMQNEGLSEEIKHGFILGLLSSAKPIRDMLFPNFHDQKSAHENQFSGMTEQSFTYSDFEHTREKLVSRVGELLTEEDKQFILGFKRGEPDWSVYDFERFPAVQWKLRNILHLIETNPEKHKLIYKSLKERLVD